MSIDQFLKPRDKDSTSFEMEIVDTELSETAIYKADYYLASSKQFRDANLNAQRAVLSGKLEAVNGEAFILNDCFISGSINGEELTAEQNKSFLERYPDLINKIDVEISKGSAFIRPVSTGSKSTQSGTSGSKRKSA